jgi:hypothetical protein
MPRAVPRPLESYLNSSNPLLRAQGQYKSTGEVPEGFDLYGSRVFPEDNPFEKFLDTQGPWAIPAGVLGGTALGGLFGGAGASGAAASSGLSVPSMPVTPGLAGTGLGGFSSSGASGMGGFFGKLFGNRGLDPTALLLGGLSMFGGDESEDPRSSFKGAGAADPITALNKALSMIDQLGASLQKRQGMNMTSSQLAPPPAPVSIPGIPFQIGGGLGTDPALRDATLLQVPPPPNAGFQGSTDPAGAGRPSRRKPGSSGGR